MNSIEKVFRILKTDLNIFPMGNRKESIIRRNILDNWTKTKNYPEVLRPFIKSSAILEREVEIKKDSNWII